MFGAIERKPCRSQEDSVTAYGFGASGIPLLTALFLEHAAHVGAPKLDALI
jgi:hypothetical protein